MAFFRDALDLLAGRGNLALGSAGKARFDAVKNPIIAVARQEDIPWPLLAGLAWTESSFDPNAKGPIVGGFCGQALGLFQICRGWAPRLIQLGIWQSETQWSDPLSSTRAAAFVLRQSGLGRLDIEEVIKRWGGFVTVDHRPFRDKVLSRATFLALGEIGK